MTDACGSAETQPIRYGIPAQDDCDETSRHACGCTMTDHLNPDRYPYRRVTNWNVPMAAECCCWMIEVGVRAEAGLS